MYRECLKLALESTGDIDLVLMAMDDIELQAAFRLTGGAAVIFEASDVPWNVETLVEGLRGIDPQVTLVGTHPHEYRNHQSLQGVRYLRRTAAIAAFISTLAGSPIGDESSFLPNTSSNGGRSKFSQRETQVLILISGGLTTMQIASRLGISAKTVENHKQALFSKLGVQNQSHAVAVGLRIGLIGTGATTAEQS
jgi:DNA-binding NarL/FixJ family response regulator